MLSFRKISRSKIFAPLLFLSFFLFGDFLSPAPAQAIEVLDWIYNFFKGFFQGLIDVLVWIIEGWVSIFVEFAYLLFDGFLIVIEGIFTLLDLSAFGIDSALDWSSLPDQLVWILCEIDFSQGVSIIVTAIIIRMIMNIIPASVTRV